MSTIQWGSTFSLTIDVPHVVYLDIIKDPRLMQPLFPKKCLFHNHHLNLHVPTSHFSINKQHKLI